MPNKPVRQSAKYKEQQYRKRMTQDRPAGTAIAELDRLEPDTTVLDGAQVSDATTIRFSPASDGAVPAVAAAVPRTTAPRPAVPRPTTTTTLNRRPPTATTTTTAVRTARGRIAAQMQEMNLTDEMAFIRSDIRRLLLLAAASFAVLIVLAFVLH